MATDQEIRRGCSLARDTVQAAREFHAAVLQPDGAGLVVFFCAPTYDLDLLAAEMARLFAGTPLIGCTTAGEIGPDGYLEGSITGFSLPAAECTAASVLIQGLSDFNMSRGHDAAEAAIDGLAGRSGQAVDPETTFAMLLSDGISTNQEVLIASLQGRMANLQMLGGSAGDDMHYERTCIYHAGRFHADAALLSLIKTSRPFRIYRCQHFFGSDTRMVVTAADPVARIVSEINAEPAAAEYARIIGLRPDQLTSARFAESPVMVRVGGEYHARSIQRMNDDGSLTFYCAIDEGVVLTLARRQDIVENLDTFFAKVRGEMGSPGLVVGFDCVLRSLEAEHRQTKHKLGRILSANNVVGFCTYGEHYRAMHVTQTFTALVFGSTGAA
nr:FIST N-terminal domain-containing protein [uncultured Rhodopila sp.]